MTLSPVKMHIPDEANIIVGQTHFIKTVEDLYEVLATGAPSMKFGIAFCEASQERLIRWDGNDKELIDAAVANAQAIHHSSFPIPLPPEPIPSLRDSSDWSTSRAVSRSTNARIAAMATFDSSTAMGEWASWPVVREASTRWTTLWTSG